jgi:hypothetical protein
MISQKNQNKSNKPFIYFTIAGVLLLLRHKIALHVRSMFVEDYYWDAIYHTDMAVIAIAFLGISSYNIRSWQKRVIEAYVGFIFGDFIDRIYFGVYYTTPLDMVGLSLVILIPLINYLIENGRKRRNNISKD